MLALPIVRIKSFSVAIALAMIVIFGGCKPGRDANSISGTIEVDAARVASRYGGRVKQVLGVKVKLDNTDGQPRAGMAADAVFPGVTK